MKGRFIFAAVTLVAALVLSVATVEIPHDYGGKAAGGVAYAATSNPTPASPGYTPMVVHFDTHTSSRTAVQKWTAPVGFRILHASATARAVSGTNPTLKIVGKDAGFVRYSGTVSTAGTTKNLTLTATPNMTDEAAQSVDFIIGGTSPSFSDITLFLWLKRR